MQLLPECTAFSLWDGRKRRQGRDGQGFGWGWFSETKGRRGSGGALREARRDSDSPAKPGFAYTLVRIGAPRSGRNCNLTRHPVATETREFQLCRISQHFYAQDQKDTGQVWASTSDRDAPCGRAGALYWSERRDRNQATRERWGRQGACVSGGWVELISTTGELPMCQLIYFANASVRCLSGGVGVQSGKKLCRHMGRRGQYLSSSSRPPIDIHLAQFIVSLRPKMPQLTQEICHSCCSRIGGLVHIPQQRGVSAITF